MISREAASAFPNCQQRCLPESALVGFVRYRHQNLDARREYNTRRDAEPSYLAFVLRGGDSVPALVPLGSAARVDGLILQWRQTDSIRRPWLAGRARTVVKPLTDASRENCVSRYGIRSCRICRMRRASSSSRMARFTS